MVEINKKVLKNGFTIIHEKRDLPITTIMLSVKFGSSYEEKKEKGIAHFIEHLCFKGTEKRGSLTIAKEIEEIGGILNAVTQEEFTSYFAKIPSIHLKKAAEVLFDIFFNPIFPEDEIKKEAKVICEEIKMYKDNPSYFVLDRIKSNLYEEPFGMNIAGTEENVLSFPRKKLIEIHNKFYTPENSFLVVVGNNDFSEICKLVEELIPERKFGGKIVIPKIILKNNREIIERKELEQTNLTIGFHFPFNSLNDFLSSEIFCSILGEGMSSKLFSEVREKRGLVYTIKSYLENGKNFSYLVIYAGTNLKSVEEVIKISLNEFSKISYLTKEEFEKAKEKVIGNFLVENEDSINAAMNISFFESLNKLEGYLKFEEEIRKVKLEDIYKLASLRKYSLVVLKPKS